MCSSDWSISRQAKCIDRVEIRRRNMIPKEAYPYQTPVMMQYDSGDPKGCLAKAADVADWAGFPARKAQSVRQGKRAASE